MTAPRIARWPLRPRSIRSKVALLTLLVVLLPLIITSWLGNRTITDLLRERALSQATAEVDKLARELYAFLENARQDVLYLAQLHSMRQLLYASRHGRTVDAIYWQRQLAEDFRIFAYTHPTYYQIRYLDVAGNEIVRVNQSLGQAPYIVPHAELQNKAHRYYFREAQRLAPGEVYVSPLDLNREHYAIEQPLHPVLRYATPLYEEDTWMGVLVVNLHAQPFLDILESTNANTHLPAEMLLVDRHGYYLVHPDEAKRWGSPHDLNTGASLWREAPAIAGQILSGQAGVLEYDGKVWVYEPIYPAPQENPTYYWVLIRREPRAQFYAAVRSFRALAGGVLFLTMLLSVALTFVVVRAVTRPVSLLKQAVEAFGQGRLDVRVPVPAAEDDELALLLAAFNRMAAAIHRDVQHLRLLNEGAMALTRHLDLCQALTTAAATLAQRFASPWVGVYRVDDEQRWQDVAAHYGPAPRLSQPTRVPTWDPQTFLCPVDAPTGEGTWWAIRLRSERQARYILALPAPHDADPVRAEAWIAVLVHQTETVLKNIHLYLSLRKHRQQLSELLNRVITAQEEERKLVAYELHDGLIQVLVGVRLHLNNALLLQEQDPGAASQALARAADELQRAIREGRRLIQGLRPTVLDDLGLALAVREMAEAMAQEHGWHLQVAIDLPRRLPPEIELTVFRIVQEALSNVRKHAQAHRVWISLWVHQGRVEAQIRDDGRGFDPLALEDDPAAVGLHSMRERARLVGGQWSVESQPGGGTTVRFWVPLTLGADNHEHAL